MKFTKTEQLTSHALEDVFEIEEFSTTTEVTEYIPSASIPDPTYDDKDIEIEQQFDEIYNLALGNTASMANEITQVEGKFKARIGEVMATNLSVALAAAKEKANLKQHKDKLSVKTGPDKNITNNNLVVTSQAELLKMLRGAQSDE